MSELKWKYVFYSRSNLLPPSLEKVCKGVESVTNPEFLLSDLAALSQTIIWLHLQSGVSVAEQFKVFQNKPLDCLIAVMSDMPHDLEGLAAFSVGAKAYCNTHSGVEVLQNIDTVLQQGGMWVGESIFQALCARSVEPAKIKEKLQDWENVLTPKEREAAYLIIDGASNKQIADAMKITERTVKAHVSAILEKLHLRNRTQLILLAKD